MPHPRLGTIKSHSRLVLFLLLASVVPARASDELVTIDEATAARSTLISIFERLDPTTSRTPYRLEVSLDTGQVTADNGKVRWAFNLRSMDPARIVVEPQGNPGYQSVRIRMWCIGGSVGKGSYCVDWGAHRMGLEMKPTYPYFDFQIYEVTTPKGPDNRWTRTRRAVEAEHESIEAFRTLISYFAD